VGDGADAVGIRRVEATMQKIAKEGCEIVVPVGADLPEITAKFQDPGGNVLGLFQERG